MLFNCDHICRFRRNLWRSRDGSWQLGGSLTHDGFWPDEWIRSCRVWTRRRVAAGEPLRKIAFSYGRSRLQGTARCRLINPGSLPARDQLARREPFSLTDAARLSRQGRRSKVTDQRFFRARHRHRNAASAAHAPQAPRATGVGLRILGVEALAK